MSERDHAQLEVTYRPEQGGEKTLYYIQNVITGLPGVRAIQAKNAAGKAVVTVHERDVRDVRARILGIDSGLEVEEVAQTNSMLY